MPDYIGQTLKSDYEINNWGKKYNQDYNSRMSLIRNNCRIGFIKLGSIILFLRVKGNEKNIFTKLMCRTELTYSQLSNQTNNIDKFIGIQKK